MAPDQNPAGVYFQLRSRGHDSRLPSHRAPGGQDRQKKIIHIRHEPRNARNASVFDRDLLLPAAGVSIHGGTGNRRPASHDGRNRLGIFQRQTKRPRCRLRPGRIPHRRHLHGLLRRLGRAPVRLALRLPFGRNFLRGHAAHDPFFHARINRLFIEISAPKRPAAHQQDTGQNGA